MESAGPLGDRLSRRRRDAKEISRISHDLFKCYFKCYQKIYMLIQKIYFAEMENVKWEVKSTDSAGQGLFASRLDHSFHFC